MSNHPIFFGNKISGNLVVVRKDSYPEGTRPADVVGKGYHIIQAPDSERARSLLSAFRSQDEARRQRDAVWVAEATV